MKENAKNKKKLKLPCKFKIILNNTFLSDYNVIHKFNNPKSSFVVLHKETYPFRAPILLAISIPV